MKLIITCLAAALLTFLIGLMSTVLINDIAPWAWDEYNQPEERQFCSQ